MTRSRASDSLGGSGIAVVTGASTGIGAALAERLAARGHSLLVTALPGEGLEDLGKDLSARFDVHVEVHEGDLTDAAVLDGFADDLRGREIAVFCANAGVGEFGDFVESYTRTQVLLDVVAVAELTAAVLPGMLARNDGAILLVGSTGGNQPVPGAATYAACKAFVNSLAGSLHAELADTGVRCTLLAPGPVHTDFAQRASVEGTASKIPEISWVSADQAAEAALSGLERGKERVAPGVPGRLLDLGGRLVPGRLIAPVLRRVVQRNV